MLRCFGIIRAVQQRSASRILFKSTEETNLSRNFSQYNHSPVTTSLLIKKNPDFRQNFIRFASGGGVTASPFELQNIPEPPQLPEAISKAAEVVADGVEPAFSTLGLGGWTPVGIAQNCMEFLHIDCDIPWWTVIMIGTLCVRTIIFPLVLVSQRNSAKMNNNLPQLQHLQTKMTEARQSGNVIDAARYSQEMMQFMKDKELNPFKNMVVPLAQAPLFISFFIGLRQMANAPVESLRDGGLFWFADLTVPDQFFLLPIICSFTMLATIELGVDGARLSAANMQTMKYVLRALPFVIIPFSINFPAAILTYWCSSNFISLIQVGFLKIPAVRDYFKIPKLITHNPEDLPIKKKGFREGLKDSWTNMKITRELEERRRLDDIMFQRAAKGAVQKTYKFDPTKPRPANAMEAKKR